MSGRNPMKIIEDKTVTGRNPMKTILVASYVSLGVSRGGDGFVIINGKLRRVPPHLPKLKELNAALNLIAQTENIADQSLRSKINDIAESIIEKTVPDLIAGAED